MVQERTPPTLSGILAAAWWRGRWSCVVAGGTLAFIAYAAWAVALGGDGLTGLRREDIGRLMRLEGYAFATGFLFAMLLPFCMAAGRLVLIAVWIAFLVTVALIGAILWSTRPGLTLMAGYLAMVGTTYLGALLDPQGAFTTSAWWQRVLAVIVLFFIGTIAFRTPLHVDSWSNQTSVMRFGAFHFSFLALAEWSGLYHLRRADWVAVRHALRRRG